MVGQFAKSFQAFTLYTFFRKRTRVGRKLWIFEQFAVLEELFFQCGVVLVFKWDGGFSVPRRLAVLGLQSKDAPEHCNRS